MAAGEMLVAVLLSMGLTGIAPPRRATAESSGVSAKAFIV